MKDRKKLILAILELILGLGVLALMVVIAVNSTVQTSNPSALVRILAPLFAVILIPLLLLVFSKRKMERQLREETADLFSFTVRQGKLLIILGVLCFPIPLIFIVIHGWAFIHGRAFDPIVLAVIIYFAIPAFICFFFYFRWRIIVFDDKLDFRPFIGQERTYYFYELGRVKASRVQPDPYLNVTLYTNTGKRLFRINDRHPGYTVLIERIASYVENPEQIPRRVYIDDTQESHGSADKSDKQQG